MITFISLALISILAIYRSQNRILKKKEIGFGITESDIFTDFSAIIKVSIYSFFGGIFSTFIGITNFLLYSEMLEKAGKTPIEASIISIALIALGSLSTTIEYFARESITINYMI